MCKSKISPSLGNQALLFVESTELVQDAKYLLLLHGLLQRLTSVANYREWGPSFASLRLAGLAHLT